MSIEDNTYIPALRFDWLTGIYDPVVALTTRERTFKSRLIKLAGIHDEFEILDIGCGTGTLGIWIKEFVPNSKVTCLDGDAKILSIAKSKAKKSGVEITFDQGMSFDMPYQDAKFDRVLSSLFFHHLTKLNKERTLEEIFRVVRPGGELHIADWGTRDNLRVGDEIHFCLEGGKKLPSEWVRGIVVVEELPNTRELPLIVASIILYPEAKPCIDNKTKAA